MFWTGVVLGCIGGLWLAVNAFRNNGALWGIGALLVPLIAQLYGLRHLDHNRLPLILSLVGVVLCMLGFNDHAAQVPAVGAGG